MFKNKYVAFGLFTMLFIGLFNLLDWLYATVIAKSGYSFSVWIDLLAPLTVGIVIGYFVFLRKKG